MLNLLNRLNFLNHFNRLMSHSGFKKYFFNTTWLFVEKILRLVIGLFVGVWVARYLGPAQYGLFNYVQAFVGLFSAFATLGLDGIVVRELIKDESKKDELLGTAFWLKIMGAIMMLIMIAIAVQFTSNDHYTNILVFIVAGSTIFQAFNVIDFYFQAKVLGKYIAMANSISLLISSIVKVVLILMKAPLIAFVWTTVFDSVILALGYLYFYIKLFPTLHPLPMTSHISHFTFDKSLAVRLLKDSWPLILSGLAAMIYMRIDQVMLRNMVDNKAVGYYSAAVRVSEAWYFIPFVVTDSLSPQIYKSCKENLIYYYRLIVFVSMPFIILINIFGKEIIAILYGQEYIASYKVLILLSWGGMFISLSRVFGVYLIKTNNTIANFKRTFIGAVSNVVLNIILIPYYDITGAGIATLLSLFITNIYYDYFDKNLKEMFYLKILAIFTFWKLTYENVYNKK